VKNMSTLFDQISSGKTPHGVCLRGEDPFLFSKLFSAYRKNGLELKRFVLPAVGPGVDVEAEAFSMSLFGGGVLLWLECKKAPSGWNKDAKSLFDKILNTADGQGLAVVLVMPQDKRIKTPSKSLEEFSCELNFSERATWIAKMNQERTGSLDKKRLDFLLHFEEPLMVIDNWIELWTLGGDLWASSALAWGDVDSLNGALALKGENPAFAWVDSVVEGNGPRAMRLLEHLLDQGSDPIQLTALLAKSARILASVVARESTSGFPPFLVKKLQYKGSARSLDLLKKCAELDVALKSSPKDARAMLLRLCV